MNSSSKDGADGFDSAVLHARSGGCASSELGELRNDCPRWILGVLDAVSMARGDKSRGPLVNEILGEWANKKRHEAMLVQRLAAGNPAAPETRGGRSE